MPATTAVATPDTPAERITALREAFHSAINDPEFLADAKRARLEIEENTGERVAEIIAGAWALPPDIVRVAKEAMSVPGGD